MFVNMGSFLVCFFVFFLIKKRWILFQKSKWASLKYIINISPYRGVGISLTRVQKASRHPKTWWDRQIESSSRKPKKRVPFPHFYLLEHQIKWNISQGTVPCWALILVNISDHCSCDTPNMSDKNITWCWIFLCFIN